MDYKYQYTTPEEKQQIITQNATLILIEEQNIIEGNFLIFTDTLPEPRIYYIDGTRQELDKLTQDNLILMDVLATMYEDMLAKGTV